MGRTKEAIAEGLSIATAAARLTVRNRILVETIARVGVEDAGGAMVPESSECALGTGAQVYRRHVTDVARLGE